MNPLDDPRALLERYFDQQASPDELAELADQLATDATAADRLVQLACLEVQLETHFAEQQQETEVEQLRRRIPLAPASPPLTRLGSALDGSWRAWPLRFFTLVTVLTGLVWSGFYLFLSAPRDVERETLATPSRATNLAHAPVVARLGRADAARWEATTASLPAGAFLRQGEQLALESGWAEVQFQSGARMLLTGPVRFTLTQDNGGVLHTGKVWADVPEQARGFVINTSQAAITDLGTEFAVAVDDQELLQVAVFDGLVEVVATGGDAQRQLLAAGESLTMTPAGMRNLAIAPPALLQLRAQGGQLAATRGVSFRLSWLSPGAGDEDFSELLGKLERFEAGLNAGLNAPAITIKQITFADAATAAQGEGVTITSNAASVGKQDEGQPATSWQGNFARLMETVDGSAHGGEFQITVGGLTVGQHYRVVFLSAQDLALTGQRVMRIASGDAASPEFDASSPKRELCPLYVVEARFQATDVEQAFSLQGRPHSRAVLSGVAVFTLADQPSSFRGPDSSD